MFPEKSESWFEEVKIRFFDVEFIGVDDKGYKKYRVKKNLTLKDSYRASYRMVTLGEYKYALCTCFFNKYGDRGKGICTHGGAAILYELYNRLKGGKVC